MKNTTSDISQLIFTWSNKQVESDTLTVFSVITITGVGHYCVYSWHAATYHYEYGEKVTYTDV